MASTEHQYVSASLTQNERKHGVMMAVYDAAPDASSLLTYLYLNKRVAMVVVMVAAAVMVVVACSNSK